MTTRRTEADLYTLLSRVAKFSITSQSYHIIVSQQPFGMWQVLVLLPSQIDKMKLPKVISRQHLASFDSVIRCLNDVVQS